jgi:hypothetical protein
MYNEPEQPRPIKYGQYLFVWIDRYDCWCIYDDNGDKVREPYWATTGECREVVDSREAL